MKKRLFSLLVLLALNTLPGFHVFAQQTRTINNDTWCDRDRSYSDDGEKYCEVREITLPADRKLIKVDGRHNGGIKIKGWDRNEILVRAKVAAHARTEEAARRLADQVEIETGSTIYADVPDARRKEWAYASFEVFVPRKSNLSLETHNGGISIEAVEGEVDFDALNGGVHLAELAGDVRGSTTNGGLNIELSGKTWRGGGLDVKTTNGGVELIVPDGYSAELETGTVNGRVRLDFPVMVQGRFDRHFTTTLGNGGKRIRAVTTNGGVIVRKG